MTPQPFPDDVEIAVTAFNSRETLPHLLECLRQAGAPDDRVTVIDLGSTDETCGWLTREFPQVCVKRFETNNGPNPGRNLAIRSASRPYVLLLDADAYVRSDAPARLRRALESHTVVGMATPVIVHAQAPDTIQYAGGSIHFMCEAINPWLDRPLVDRGTDLRDVGAAPGMGCLIDCMAARRIGLFDERYFMGKDDGDFCHRLRIAGYRIVEDPQAIVEHGSRPRSTWLFSYQIRNRWHFLLKNYELRTLLLVLPALAIHEPIQFVVLTMKGHFKAYLQAVRGLLPWLKTLRRERRELAAIRVVHDRALLSAAPLIVRQDLVGGRIGRTLKAAYDAWLGAYWKLIRPLVP